MRNSLAAGRRLAFRIVLAQIGVTIVLAALFLVQGWRPATSAVCGGMAIAAGTGLLGSRMFAGTVASAGFAWMRLLIGTAAKWIVVLGAIYLVLGRWQLPAIPLIATLIAALSVNLLAFKFKN